MVSGEAHKLLFSCQERIQQTLLQYSALFALRQSHVDLMFQTMHKKCTEVSEIRLLFNISIGNSMICSDIWHKYHEWYFKLLYVISGAVRRVKFETNFEISQVIFTPNITYNSCYYLFKLHPARDLEFSHVGISN